MSLQDKLKEKLGGDKPNLGVDDAAAEAALEAAIKNKASEVEEPPAVDDEADKGAWQESTIQEAILKTAFAEAASYDAPEGAFKNNRLHQVVLKNGTTVKPNKYGYYEDATGEALQLLEYYATTGLVTKVVATE